MRTVTETYGDRGRTWLLELPTLLLDIARRNGLSLAPPFPNLTYNYVAPAIMADGTEAVLKVCVPNPEFNSEISALTHFNGVGSVSLLHADASSGLLLLERLIPGEPLTIMALGDDASDDKATSIACNVIRSLTRKLPPTSPFRTTADLAQGFLRLRSRFGGGVGPFPRDLVDLAERVWEELEATAQDAVLLHGDLHHDNIIYCQPRGAWLAIDPKGYIGDPGFETGALLRNLWRDRCEVAEPEKRLNRRLDKMSDELNIARSRIQQWGFCQAMLSVWWSYEDGDPDWASGLDIAAMISAC